MQGENGRIWRDGAPTRLRGETSQPRGEGHVPTQSPTSRPIGRALISNMHVLLNSASVPRWDVLHLVSR